MVYQSRLNNFVITLVFEVFDQEQALKGWTQSNTKVMLKLTSQISKYLFYNLTSFVMVAENLCPGYEELQLFLYMVRWTRVGRTMNIQLYLRLNKYMLVCFMHDVHIFLLHTQSSIRFDKEYIECAHLQRCSLITNISSYLTPGKSVPSPLRKTRAAPTFEILNLERSTTHTHQ